MSQTPLVSLCIPTHNGERYLREALESALAQTYPNLEIILVDDASRDATVAIAEEILSGVPNARIERNVSNLGLVGNWNRCVELSKGDYFKFLFQDDSLDPTCVERLVGLAESQQGLVACMRQFRFEADANPTIVEFFNTIATELQATQSLGAEEFCQIIARSHVNTNIVGEPTCVLLRKSDIEKYGKFDSQLKQMCDWEMWLRIATNEGLALVPEQLCTFRIHGASTTSTNTASNISNQDDYDMFFIRKRLTEEPVFAAFRKNRRRSIEAHRQYLHTALNVLQSNDLPKPVERALGGLTPSSIKLKEVKLRVKSRLLRLTDRSST